MFIVLPYLYTLYDLLPSGDTWESPFGTYYSQYYESVNVAAWTLIGKLVPLYLLFLWFFTCKHWWYHAILVPICLYAFQSYGVINEDIRFTDVKDIYFLAPIVLIMAIFSYTIRTKVFDKIHGIDLSELSRVSLKGDLKKGRTVEIEEQDEEEEDIFMG